MRLLFSFWQLLQPQWHSSGLLVAFALALSYCSYNSIVLAQLYESLGEWTQIGYPAHSIVVALLGLCLYPTARARLTSQQQGGSSSSRPSSGCNSQDEMDASTSSRTNSAGCSSTNSNSPTCDQGSTAGGSFCSSFKLARAPFADLSCGISTSYSCSSKAARRRLPRLSIELTPLPRLSLEFQQRRRRSNSSRRRLSSSSACGLGDCSLFAASSCSGSTGPGDSWAPTMSRIQSGQDLQAMDDVAGAAAPLAPAGNPSEEATASVGQGPLPAGLEHLDQMINETHLLQFGALMGEASSRADLVAAEAGGPVGHPQSFYGSADTDEFLDPWEPLMMEASNSVMYWAWRRPLRKGLFMYMTRSVFLEASPAELRAFMNDDAYRVVWDSSMTLLRRLAVPTQQGGTSAGGNGGSNASVEAMAAAVAARTAAAAASAAGNTNSMFSAAASLPAFSSSSIDGSSRKSGSSVLDHETSIMQALVQFPKPMASRSYVYCRRVWHRPADGGCYCLAKSCSLPDPPALSCRAVAVDDYCSGCVIRSPAPGLLPPGYSGSAAEVFMVYFEDSHVRAGLANLGIKKGLWPLVQRTDKALRVYQAGAAANVHLQHQPEPDLEVQQACQLQGSSSTPSPVFSKCGSLQLPSAQHLVQLDRQASLQSLPLRSIASVPCVPLAGLEADAVSDDEDDEEQELVSQSCAMPAAAALAAAPLPAASPAPAAHAPVEETSTAAAAASEELVSCDVPVIQMKPPGKSTPVDHIPGAVAATPLRLPAQPDSQQPQLQGQEQQCAQPTGITSHCSSHGKGSSCGKVGWWGSVLGAVGGALGGSGQLLAAASIALWRTHTRLALMLPSLEWRLLHWLLRRLAPPCWGLLGVASHAAGGGGSNRTREHGQLENVNSHPIGDWAHPGLLPQLKQLATGPSLLRIPSHPITADELCDASPAAGACCQHHYHCCCCAAAVSSCCGRRLAQAAFGAGAEAGVGTEALLSAAWPASSACSSSCCRSSSSMQPGSSSTTGGAAMSFEEAWRRCGGCCSNGSTGASQLNACEGTPAASCSTRCSCSCGRTSAAGSSSSSMCRASNSSYRHSSGGASISRIRDSSGGRRHRRVVVRLMQAAGVRLAHKLLSVLEHPGSPVGHGAAESTGCEAEF